jgi:glycerol-3-phosphate dehydrogenase
MPTTLVRDVPALAARRFDVLVIGGGIYGLTIACDAAQRGLSVALIERGDFGSGTSFNHLRTIHGGLRYLQSLDIARARESVRERRTLAQIAPWAVRPLPFVLPLERSISRGPLAMRAGFMLDRLVALDRNDGLPASHHLPAGRVLGADAARAEYPALPVATPAGAAVWYDYVTTDADRLTFAWAVAAAEHDARLANYVEADTLTSEDGRVTGALAVDRLTGHHLCIDARSVVNATGARVNDLLAPFGAGVALPLLQAMNVATRHPPAGVACGVRSRSGRNLFQVPWQGHTLFGTWESPTTRLSCDTAVGETDLRAFIAELNDAFPSYRLTRDDVTFVHRGIVPARVRTGHPPALDGHELVFEHRAEGLDGLISVAGTKYTTARAVAERIVDRLERLLDVPHCPSQSANTPLPRVASTGDDLLRHAARHEMVMSLQDAVVRRTTLGALGCPDDAALAHAAAIVGDELGWPAERRRDEIAALRRMY